MLSAPDAEARCSAMWALSHLVNDAAPAVCEAVMAALPWEQCYTLLQDSDIAVQVCTPSLVVFLRALDSCVDLYEVL